MTSPTRNQSILVLAFTAGLLFTQAPPVAAQEDARNTRPTAAMSQQIFEALSEIQELLEAEDYVSAQTSLDALKARKGISDYELAQTWNLQGYALYQQDKVGPALSAYENLMTLPDVPPALQLSTLKIITQLKFMSDDYSGALETYEKLMAIVAEPSAEVVMLEGQIYYQMGDFPKALPPLLRAVEMYRNQGVAPKENWLLLLHSCYLELEDYDNLLIILKELVARFPKDTYVLTLAGVYSELGDTKKQLALTEVLYETGAIDPERHAANLANLYLHHNIPYKAAKILSTEMEAGNVEENERNLRMLSQAWYGAREYEKSIPPLRRAAEMSGDGEYFVRLAQSHTILDQWKATETAIRQALEIGNLKRPDQAYLLLGMALLNQDNLEGARKAFESAAGDARSEVAAGNWIKYVQSEIERQQSLQQHVEYQHREKDEILKALELQAQE